MAQMSWMTHDPDTLPLSRAQDRGDARQRAASTPATTSTPEVDAPAWRRPAPATDQDRRAELYREMQVIVQEEWPWVFVANWVQNAVDLPTG